MINVGNVLGSKNDSYVLTVFSGADSTFMPNLLRPFFLRISTGHHLVLATVLTIALAVVMSVPGQASPLPSTSASITAKSVTEVLFGPELEPAAWHEIFLIVIFFSMVVTPALASRQWTGYERLIPHMLRCESLVSIGRGAATVADEVLSTNRWIYNSRFLRIPLLTLSLTLAILVLEAQMQMENHLRDGIALTTHDNRWGITSNAAGQLIYLVAGTLGIYVVTIQNIVGCRIILAVLKIRKRTRFGVDLINIDGSWGWRPVRAVMGATYAEIAVHGLGLLALALTILPDDPRFFIAAVPALEWVITVPIYAAVPLWLIGAGMRAYRSRELLGLQQSIVSPSNSRRFSLDVASRVDRLNSVPRVPFLGLPEKTLFIVAQVANFSACYAVVVAVLSGWRIA